MRLKDQVKLPHGSQAGRMRKGQTLIIALIVLGVLLVIGFVFLGVVSRNIKSTFGQQQRNLASDLAEAGVRYAHSQMLSSELGADWHGAITTIANNHDPDKDILPSIYDPAVIYGVGDMVFIAPSTFYVSIAKGNVGNPVATSPAFWQPTGGGPDGLGPYTRLSFDNGRALIRARYAPTDPSMFSTQNPAAGLRKPGKAHNYLLIDSYGRPGSVNSTDPTLAGKGATGTQKRLLAMVSIGVIESARYESNLYKVSRPIEIGVPPKLGLQYEGFPVAFPYQLGGIAIMPNLSGTGAPAAITGLGGFYANGDVKIYGQVNASLSSALGDQWNVAGRIIGANGTSGVAAWVSGTTYVVNDLALGSDGKVYISVAAGNVNNDPTNPVAALGHWDVFQALTLAVQDGAYATTTTSLSNPSNPSLDSNSDLFSTILGSLRDGIAETDEAGFPRASGRKDPPLITSVDPETGESRYVRLTAESGKMAGAGNSGRYGHGRGVYVGNADDRQMRSDEVGRENVGTAESLVYDWLNPNNGQANSGWQGPYYVPRGAFLKLLSDGFIITLDSRGPAGQRTWKDPDGTDTGSNQIKYRIGNVGGVPYIVDTYTPGVNINASVIDYTLGVPFNGVVYFAGNVRVRGSIPTDVPMLVVSNATIYVEGSITKGVIGNDFTVGRADLPAAVGTLLTRDSQSMIGLFAKDYVTLNTTQFFGADFNQTIEEVKDVPSAVGYDPIRMRSGGAGMSFLAEMLLDPATGASASAWSPYAMNYVDAVTGSPLAEGLLMTQTMDDGPAPNSFVSLNLNPGMYPPPSTNSAPYLFPEGGYNSAQAYFPPAYVTPGYPPSTAGFVPMYGLGAESWQRYSKFETWSFPIVDNTFAYSLGVMTAPGNQIPGNYQMLAQQSNEFQFFPNSVGSNGTNDHLFARLALAPHDVRIEATLYAEQGSYFVIPGPPFNPNPNDTRDAYDSDAAANGAAQANLDRIENFGTGPNAPFYGEPLDVKVSIIGAVSENMPPPISQQAEWLKRWGWIPRRLGSSGSYIPVSHSVGYNLNNQLLVPNLTISYDPTLGTASASGEFVRVDANNRALPPIPRLPVSSTLAYFGEVNP